MIKKTILHNISHFHQGVQNWFSKQETELSKQEKYTGITQEDFKQNNIGINPSLFRPNSI